MREAQRRVEIVGPISSGDQASVREWLKRLNAQSAQEGKPLKFVSRPIDPSGRVGVFALVGSDRKGEVNVKNR